VKRISLLLIGFLALAGVVGYVATSDLFARSKAVRETSGGPLARTGISYASSVPAASPVPAGPAAEPGLDPALGQQSLASKTAASGGNDAAAPTSASGAAGTIGAPSVTAVGPKIVKTANLVVEVKAGDFQNAWSQASLVAEKYHGFVVSSSTEGSQSKSGNLLIRVPSESFDLALGDLTGLGSVDKQSVNGQDVSSQFVDLSARLRTWQAQENVLLRLMDKANSIGETMQVQRELQQVQFQIEDIKGQLRMLNDQTSFGTIQLNIHEPGVVVNPQPVTGKPSLVNAWNEALAAFLGVISLVIVGLGYLIPVALLGGLVWFAYKRIHNRNVSTGAADPA
jgi:hypothetical protein